MKARRIASPNELFAAAHAEACRLRIPGRSCAERSTVRENVVCLRGQAGELLARFRVERRPGTRLLFATRIDLSMAVRP